MGINHPSHMHAWLVPRLIKAVSFLREARVEGLDAAMGHLHVRMQII